MRRNTFLVLDSSNYCVEDAIHHINHYILMKKQDTFSIDISKYNFLEATNICIISSTFLFNQNPESKITWIVNSVNTQKTINRLKLKNISLEVKSQTEYSVAIAV